MRFPASFIDELRARLPVSEVVGRRVKLRKAGREWQGLSPFNAEKTPSFYVNDQKMRWFDFSAGRDGNIFDFVMATEGVSFPEAVQRLAAEAGMALPQSSPAEAAREERRAGLLDVCEWAAQYFQACLTKPEGARARAYLKDRGLAGEAVTTFRLGYAPRDRYDLRDHLAAKGASVAVMAEAGLLIHGDDIAVPFDRFRDRVMFPIADRSGRVIAFGGRAMEKDVQPKYLNSPETPLFHKGAGLYNHHLARKAAADTGAVIAVEGYVDAIAMTLAGFPHVVASLGTALTPEQCELMWRIAPEPVLCFDGDGAGRRAAFKAVDTALPLLAAGRSFRFAFLPEGQDPDDLAKTGGAGAIRAVLDGAKPLVDVLWMRESELSPLDTPERRAGLERRLVTLAGEIRDEVLRRHYLSEIRDRLRGLTGSANRAAAPRPARPDSYRGPRRFGQPEPHRGYRDAPLPGPSASLAQSRLFAPVGVPPREAFIAALLMAHPSLLEQYAEDLAHVEFLNPDVTRLRDGLLHVCAEHPHDHVALEAALDARGYGALRHKVAAAAIPHWCLKPEAAEADADQELHQALTLQRRAGRLNKDLKLAERAFAQDDSERNFAALRDARARLSAFEGTEASLEGFGAMSGRLSSEM